MSARRACRTGASRRAIAATMRERGGTPSVRQSVATREWRALPTNNGAQRSAAPLRDQNAAAQPIKASSRLSVKHA